MRKGLWNYWKGEHQTHPHTKHNTHEWFKVSRHQLQSLNWKLLVWAELYPAVNATGQQAENSSVLHQTFLFALCALSFHVPKDGSVLEGQSGHATSILCYERGHLPGTATESGVASSPGAQTTLKPTGLLQWPGLKDWYACTHPCMYMLKGALSSVFPLHWPGRFNVTGDFVCLMRSCIKIL